MFYFVISFIFLLGLCIGSFLNCLIYRLHEGKSLGGRSFCPKCKHGIAWYDNIPVISFILLRGKCRHCAGRISLQYPVVEFITGLLFVLAFNIQYPISNIQSIFNIQYQISNILISQYPSILALLRDWFLISIMIIIFIYDLRWYLILDIISLPACAVVIILNLLIGMSWQNMLISGIIGGSFFLIQFLISRGKWIGGGDIRLGLLMGLALGWPLILEALFIAYILGSIVGIYLIVTKKKEIGSQVPLGIFLSVATVVTLFWGSGMLGWYIRILGY
jgi:leader peptidase (prepilin peptidase) / N-methyltransferase